MPDSFVRAQSATVKDLGIPEGGLKIGDSIPEALWHLPLQVVNQPEGKDTITLNDYRGKLIILDFWATWCKPCIQSIEHLAVFQRQVPEGLVVLPVLSYDNTTNALPFMQKKGWQLPSIVGDTLLGKVIFPDPYAVGRTVCIKNGIVSAFFHFPKQRTAMDSLIVATFPHVVPPVPPIQQADTAAALLPDKATQLDEVVVETGFYNIARERATGSFTHIDSSLLNRSISPNILQRLEGVASGVQFKAAGSTSADDIRIRGIATIESSETPLVVLDNFPYEGDINALNPNDVISVTVLKDAAAASIWGARAGNGVIVITTKNGKYNQPAQVSLTNNVSLSQKPDLYYSQSRLPSETVMQIEKEKYERGGYYLESEQQSPFPEYVELLISREKGHISDIDFLAQEQQLQQTDVRKEALKYLYQPALDQQYSLNISGGGTVHRYYVSAGYNKNRTNIIGNSGDRLNLGMSNTFKPHRNVQLSAGLWYTSQQNNRNGLGMKNLGAGTVIGVSPYIRLSDAEGRALPIVREYRLAYTDQAETNGLLDWQYRPLDEARLADNTDRSSQLRLDLSADATLLTHLRLSINYQYLLERSQSSSYYDPSSYFVRNLVNRFTQADGSQVIPNDGILQAGSPQQAASHSGRVQLNYDRQLGAEHQLMALVGTDLRQQVINGYPGYTIYGYDKDLLLGTAYFDYTRFYSTLPAGSGQVDQPSVARSKFTDRYLSYFGNAAYTFRQRYLFSASARWDGSNLFGVKTNQKGTPLWSAGGSWEISRESFFNLVWLPYLRLRVTYGSAGNINKSVSVYPVVRYGTDDFTKLPVANLESTGNPALRWERVNTFNTGMDLRITKAVGLTVDYYIKNARDLIGVDFMDPVTGIIEGGFQNKINYASLRTSGIDFQLYTTMDAGRLRWRTDWLLSYVSNRILHFNTKDVNSASAYLSPAPPPVTGRSRDLIYSLPWYGLHPQTGQPIIYPADPDNSTYSDYYQNVVRPDDLVQSGLTVPPLFGSLRNTFTYKQIELSFLISFKWDYVFRRSSMVPGGEYQGAFDYHMDYFKRWKKPGDEQFTNVPAYTENFDTYQSLVYSQSQTLTSSGNHIRLQDIRLSYAFSPWRLKGLATPRFNAFLYANNLGILWRANKNKLDPDFPAADYPLPRTYALGLQITF